MLQHKTSQQLPASPSTAGLMSPQDVHREYGIPLTTQAVWRCADRYGFRALVIKLGSGVRYKRADIEAWLESRRQVVDDERRSLGAKEVA